MAIITKLTIATQQLEDALEAYFAGRYHSATVLAGAAEQLLAGYVLKHGLAPAWPEEKKIVTKIANLLNAHKGADEKSTTEKDIGDLMNHAYNHSKHAGTKDHEVSFDPKFEAGSIIGRALSNFDALSAMRDYDLPDLPLAQRFYTEPLDEVTLEVVTEFIGTNRRESA